MKNAPIPKERWEELYRQEFPRLYRAVVAVVRDSERALDGLHDAFLEGLRRPPGSDANLTGWLFRVAVRHARRSRVPRLLNRPDQVDDVARLLDRIEVGRMLALLTERQRAIVVAQYFLGLEQKEIAELLGIRTGTVSATLAQAKARLRMEASNVR